MTLDELKAWARPVALQTSFFAALGFGAYTLRRLSTPTLHPTVAERSTLVAQFPALAATASQLAGLGDEEALRRLLDKLECIAELDTVGGPAAQWKISRLNAEVLHDAQRMCRGAPRARSDEVFRAVLECQNEVVPQMQDHLDNLLHNHLLARAPLGQ